MQNGVLVASFQFYPDTCLEGTDENHEKPYGRWVGVSDVTGNWHLQNSCQKELLLGGIAQKRDVSFENTQDNVQNKSRVH
jgi:hypothetical protein